MAKPVHLPHVVENGGVPLWWPEFCSAYDITAGAWLASLLLRAHSKVGHAKL